jgi:serine protease
MTKRNVGRFVSSALLVGLAFGCSDNTPDTGPSSGLLQVDPPYSGFLTEETVQLTATLNGAPAAVTWQSSDQAIATVSSSGLVTGVTGGRAAITATMVSDPSQTRSASVTVTAPPTLVLGTPQVWDGIESGNLERDQGLVYRFEVPAGATSLTVEFTGGTGDGDIYVQAGSAPDVSGNENPGCHSYNGGNDESCTVDNPVAGTWFVFIAVWDPYAGAKLTATAN